MVQTADKLSHNDGDRDREDKLIGGTYKLIRHLSSGGMGSIFYGEHILTGQSVAIKMLHPDFSSDPTLRSRFFEEAKALANLTHPNIVELKNFIEEDGKLYLIMQYIEGKNIAELLQNKKKLPLEEAIPIVIQVLEGLNYIHGKNLVHRDIKPSNIMISREGIVKLTDFGIAKNRSRPGLTATGMTVGTFHYMSPEQIVGNELDARSDIYSLGISLFEMVTGQLPFDAPTEYSICQKHLMEKLPSIRKIDPELPASLDRILKKATAKDPKKRYQSAAEFSQALLEQFGHLMKKYPFTYMQPILSSSSSAPRPRGCIGTITIITFTFLLIAFFGYLTVSFLQEDNKLNKKIYQLVEQAKQNLQPLWNKVVKNGKSPSEKVEKNRGKNRGKKNIPSKNSANTGKNNIVNSKEKASEVRGDNPGKSESLKVPLFPGIDEVIAPDNSDNSDKYREKTDSRRQRGR